MESQHSVLKTVGQLIDEAITEDGTKINFKLMQTILHVLAQQLRILNRRVRVQSATQLLTDESTYSLTVRELKLVAKVPKTSKDLQSVKTTQGLRRSTKLTEPPPLDTKVLEVMDTVEEQREKQLRVIHQRADSYEEPEKDLVPMKSLPSIEKMLQKEKILVVERVSSTQSRTRTTKSAPQIRDRSEKLSIVTQEEFDDLQKEVQELATIFQSGPGKIDSAQLMLKLKMGTNLNDSMAALQLAARIEAAEETIQKLTGLLNEVINSLPKHEITTMESSARDPKKAVSGSPKHSTHDKTNIIGTESEKQTSDLTCNFRQDYITDEVLRDQLKKCRDEYTKKNDQLSKQITELSGIAKATISKYEGSATAELDLKERLQILETDVEIFGNRVTKLDTMSSIRLTDFQERLTQLQFDLEFGIEKMAEALANRSGDPDAVAELNRKFSLLQIDFDVINNNQGELDRLQTDLRKELESVQTKLHFINEIKCDREEVVDSLKDKVGIGDLNGLVPLEQFKCIQKYLEDLIQKSYDRFNSQEIVWQKLIDDIYSELDNKAAITVLDGLKAKMEDAFNKIREEYQRLSDIVGEPNAAITSKILFRDTKCVSCNTPANMKALDDEQMEQLRSLERQRPPTIGAEAAPQTCPKADGDHEKCYFGLPMPKGHFCRRYCGGSHTRLDKLAAQSIIVTSFNKPAPENIEYTKGPCQCATDKE